MSSPASSQHSNDGLPSIPGCDTIIDLAYVTLFSTMKRSLTSLLECLKVIP